MVGEHERTVSPSSSSTRRSTPCVLGCCGPLLTVIVSVRLSAIDQLSFHDVTNDVQYRPMNFLHSRRHWRWHIDMNRCGTTGVDTVMPGQSDRLQSACSGQFERRDDVS